MSANKSIAPPTKAKSPPRTRISTEEAAALLGMHRSTLYGMARRGQLPAEPFGERRWKFFREPLERWREKHLAAGLEGQP